MVLPPPTGHASWLDYAVNTMETRSLEIEYLFEDTATAPTREAMRDSARAELNTLRRAASTASPEQVDADAAVTEMHAFMQDAEPRADLDIKGFIENGRA